MSKEEAVIDDDLEDGEIATDDDDDNGDDEVVLVSTTNPNTNPKTNIDKTGIRLISKDVTGIDNYLTTGITGNIHKSKQLIKNKDICYTDDDFANNIENAIAKELLKEGVALTGLSSVSASTPVQLQTCETNLNEGSSKYVLKGATSTDDDDLRQKLKRLRRKHDGMNSGDREKRRKRNKHDDERDDDRGRGVLPTEDFLDEYEMICMRGGSPPPTQPLPPQQYGSSGIYDSDDESNSSYDSYDSGEYQRRLMQDARQRRRNKDRRDMGGGSRGSVNVANSMLKKRRGGTGNGDKRKHRDGDSDVEERQPRKMELCKFYLMDCCAKREKCLYMHSDFPCKFYYLGMKSHSSETCKFSHGKPLTEHLRGILLKHLETAPKEILGEFPRISRENAINMLNTTHIRLLVEHGMEQSPNEGGQNTMSGSSGMVSNSSNYIPSLLDIVTKPPPNSLIKNGMLFMDNGGSNNNNNGSMGSNKGNDRKQDKPRKTRWCSEAKNLQNTVSNSGTGSSTAVSATSPQLPSQQQLLTTAVTVLSSNTTIPDYLSLKNLTGVITQKQIEDLSNMGIENLDQINQLTVAQLNELGLTISQINEIQLNAMNISKLGLSTKAGEKSNISATQGNRTPLQILKLLSSTTIKTTSKNNKKLTHDEDSDKLTSDLGNKDTDLRLAGSSRTNQDVDMRLLSAGQSVTDNEASSSAYNTLSDAAGDSALRNDDAPFDYTQYVKDSNINLSDSDERSSDRCDNKGAHSPVEDDQELLIDESYYPSDEEKNKSDDEDKENDLKIVDEKTDDSDRMDDKEENNKEEAAETLQQLQPPKIPSLASVLLPNMSSQLGSLSKIDLSSSVTKLLTDKPFVRSDKIDKKEEDGNNNDEVKKGNDVREERRDPRLRENIRKNSSGDDDSEGNFDEKKKVVVLPPVVHSYDPRIMYPSIDESASSEKRDPRLSSGETPELASYDPRSMYGSNSRLLGLGREIKVPEHKVIHRDPREDLHNLLPRDPRLSSFTANSQSSPVSGTETAALSSSSSQETTKSGIHYPEVTQRPSMYDGAVNSDSDSSSSPTNRKSDKDMRMTTFFVDSANSSPNCDTDLRLPFKPIPANYILNSDSDSSGSSSNKKSDKDMRMPFFVDSANSSPSRDIDLRLPFKPILANYIPAKEIDASIKLNAPMVYKVTDIDIPKPDYSEIKRSISVPEDSIDPRVRRMFCLPQIAATTVIGPSSTGEITIMTGAQAYERNSPRIDPRRRKELSASGSGSAVGISLGINTPLTLSSPPLNSGKNSNINAQVIDMQNVLKSSLWYRDLSSTQKITVNQQLAIVNFELRKYHVDANVDKVFDMTFITTNQLLQQILRSLGVYITDVGAIENVNDITGQHLGGGAGLGGSMMQKSMGNDMHQQQHSSMGGNQGDLYGMRMMGNRSNFGHPSGIGFMQQYGSGGDARPGILGMAPNLPFGHYDPSEGSTGRFDDQQIYNEMGMNPGYPQGPFGGSFNDGNYFGRSQGGRGGQDGGDGNRNRNNFRSGGRNIGGGNSGNDRWSNNNSRNLGGNNRGNCGGGSGNGGGSNNSRRNYDNRDNRSRRDNNNKTKN